MKMVLKSIAEVSGVTSVRFECSKNLVIIVGKSDPLKIIEKIRKINKSANLVSVEREELRVEKKEKKSAFLKHSSFSCNIL